MQEWNRIIQQIVDEIDLCTNAKHSEAMTLSILSRKFGYSQPYTSRKFREVSGVKLQDYLRSRRMVFAAKEIRETNKGILEIAMDFGFSSNEAFTRAFRKAYGIPPSEYRKKPVSMVSLAQIHPRRSNMKKITAISIGFGGRASTYCHYAIQHPEELEIVAVADPNPARRQLAQQRHNLAENRLFSTWEELAALPKMADFAIIGTQDNLHFAPAMALIEKGYDLLLEKPMAPTPQECRTITEAAERKGVRVVVCHVLRFNRMWKTIKRIIDEGRLGRIISIVAMENVGHHHHANSYVRGPWRKAEDSSCMIMAKCCHDMDILQWLIGKKCTQVQSFGGLSYFTRDNKPEGAPSYCIDGCPNAETCHYNAAKYYLEDPTAYEWLKRQLTLRFDPPATVDEFLHMDQYGRCVFDCDNDVVDHQVVNLQYEDGCTVSFTMCAFNEGGRFIRIFGTDGELVASSEKKEIELFTFGAKKWADERQRWEVIPHDALGNDVESGHGGGDTGIMEDVLSLLRGETPSNSICDVRVSYENHLTGFAAEEARVTNQIIRLEEYEANL